MKHSIVRIMAAIIVTNLIFVIVAGALKGMGLFDDMFTNFGVLNTLAILYLYLKADKKHPMSLGFQVKRKDIFYAVSGIIITLMTVLGFIWILVQKGSVVASVQWEKLLTIHFMKLVLIGMVGWFFAALKEEVLTRGYFMANLYKMGLMKMLVLTSVIFMAMHFVTGEADMFKAGSWLMGGIVYGYIYLKSGSLTVATIIHAAHNQLNDMVIHGSEAAFILLTTKVADSDKLIYELVLGLFILASTFAFYGKNGWLTPAENLKVLWRNDQPKSESINEKNRALL